MFKRFAGLEIIINDSMTGETVKRSWRERLLSWPWRPWNRTKFNPLGGKPLISDGQVLNYQNQSLIMNSRTKNMMDKTITQGGAG